MRPSTAAHLDRALAVPTGDPAVQRVELSVGDATRSLSSAQVRDIVAALIV